MIVNLYQYAKTVKFNHDTQATLRKKLRSPEVILVHQMGKVGSSAIVASLEARELSAPVFHTHSLNPQKISDRVKKAVAAGRKISLGSHLRTSLYLQSFLATTETERSWQVITLVREPIIRNISAFFQNINDFFPDFMQRYAKGELTMAHVMENFLENYSHEIPLQWLDLEIKEVFGIDVYSERFPTENGYQIFHRDNFSLLLIRLEDLNHCAKKAFQEFMAIEALELKQENLSVDKTYNDIYNQFKQTISLSPSYIDKMYCSQYMRHFYTDSEISHFREKWSSRSSCS